MQALDFALQFLAAGIAVIPIQYQDKRPAFHLLPRDDNGHPTWEGYKRLLPAAGEVQRWFAGGPINYGVVAGWQQLVILDFDDAELYSEWQIWTSRQGGAARFAAEHAFRVRTSRGVHVYLRMPGAGKNRKLGGIDFKAIGYVLGPGSVHTSGAEYTALRKVLHFPVIGALSDVLPADLLVQHAEVPDHVRPPAPPAPTDVWQAVNNPVSMSTGLVERIKQRFRMEDLFTDLRPERNGNYAMTVCPLHDDHNPSMWVDLKNQRCGCFAGCTPKSLDVIDLYARLMGIDNTMAIFELGRAA